MPPTRIMGYVFSRILSLSRPTSVHRTLEIFDQKGPLFLAYVSYLRHIDPRSLPAQEDAARLPSHHLSSRAYRLRPSPPPGCDCGTERTTGIGDDHTDVPGHRSS